MKNLLVLIAILTTALVSAQAFKGAGDNKLQIGANLQDAATGINLSFDYGLGENISVGVYGTYALSVKSELDADFGDRIDLKGRFNAHLGSVLGIDDNFDLYPGLDLSLKNFGGHVGARYFFSEGIGIFTEALFPIAKYNNSDLKPADYIHNQFMVNVGAVFSL
jgi:outer membrane protein G